MPAATWPTHCAPRRSSRARPSSVVPVSSKRTMSTALAAGAWTRTPTSDTASQRSGSSLAAMAGDPPDVDAVTVALRTHGYLPDEGLATAIFLAMTMRRPLLLEGEAGVGKTEVAKALSRLDRWTADPPAVLRGHRRRPGGVRLGLRPPAAPPARHRGDRRGGRAQHRRRRGRPLPGALPRQAGVAAGDRPHRRASAGAADRRDRPRRRRVRGLPAGGAVGLADHGARARRVPHRAARRSSCSRATARATCTTPSSAAASTTGSSTRASTGRWRSCTCACPRSAAPSPARSPPPSPRSASSTCTSRPASPRRSTGPPPSDASASASSTSARWRPRSARCSSTARTTSGSPSTASPTSSSRPSSGPD